MGDDDRREYGSDDEDQQDAELAAALDEWADESTAFASLNSWAEDAPGAGELLGRDAKRQRSDTSTEPADQRPSTGDAETTTSGSLGPDPTPSTGRGLSLLNDLPTSLLLRVLSFLSADDMCKIATVCRMFINFSGEGDLWRRLYCARWGRPRGSHQSMKTWKVQYHEQDAEEAESALSGVAESMREVFLEMQRAKRQRALGRSLVDDLMPVNGNVADHIAAWRQARGFVGEGAAVRPDLSRRQQQYSFHAISSTHWLCNETGWLHVCDSQCGERVVDPGSQMLVCPVSGVLTDRLMTECECREAAAPRGATDDPGEVDFFGNLARAYEIGYSCNDERELQQYWLSSGYQGC